MEIVKVNSKNPEKEIIKKAAKIIQKGGLVAFPTETVYGLGANALNKKAVRKIFEVKGRPLDNPIIVHIADFKDLKKLAKKIPKKVEILSKKFWPGPLTLILFKKKVVPDEVTAQRKTVAIRMPKNKIALELIKMSRLPIAAPSANLAGRPSATTAEDVFDDFDKKIDLILDGGKTEIGLESTVLDLTSKTPQILRPGGISFERIKKILKNLKLHPSLLGKKLKGKAKSPGMKYRHYAPRAKLILVKGEIEEMKEGIKKLIKKYKKLAKKIGVMATSETKDEYSGANLVISLGSRKNLRQIAKNLFRALRRFDRKGVEIILAETFPKKGMGLAIMDRIEKAAGK